MASIMGREGAIGFSSYAATKAAVMGVGVVMADLVLCREELESGALVAPFPNMICPSEQGGVCLLGGRHKWTTPKVEAFKSWAYAMAAEDRNSVRGMETD